MSKNGQRISGTDIHVRTLNSKGKLVPLSLEGHIEEHHRFSLELSYEQYQLFLNQELRIEKQMEIICNKHYSEQMKLLQTLPGVKKQAAMQIIAEIGVDMKAFGSSGKLAGWAGLRPRNDESAGKFKSTAITKGNKYLRRIIVQCAWAASRTKGTYYKSKFEQLCIRKSRKKAQIAIARKLLVVIWNILSEKQQFNPRMLPVYNKDKILGKMKYHQKELEKLKSLGFDFA